MDSTKALFENKKEYLQYIQDILVEPFIHEFETIYQAALSSSSSGKVLQQFQTSVSRIAEWNHVMVQALYERVLEQSKCEFLSDLVRAIFITYVRFHLASHGKLDCIGKIKIRVPNAENFLHRCMISCARAVWMQPYLFYHSVRTIERQHNRIQIEQLFRKAIATTIRNAVPWNQILPLTVESLQHSDAHGLATSDDEGEGDEERSEGTDGNTESPEESEDDNQDDSDSDGSSVVDVETIKDNAKEGEEHSEEESEEESEEDGATDSEAEIGDNVVGNGAKVVDTETEAEDEESDAEYEGSMEEVVASEKQKNEGEDEVVMGGLDAIADKEVRISNEHSRCDENEDDDVVQLTEQDIDYAFGNATSQKMVTIREDASDEDPSEEQAHDQHITGTYERKTVVIAPKKIHKPRLAPRPRVTDAFF